MPLRVALILLGLFVVCLAIVLLAWLSGSEFYLFVPPLSRWGIRRLSAYAPPTHPSIVVGLLATCVALYFYSPHYALVWFTILLGSLVLGSPIGYFFFAWKPTVAQVLLTLAMIAEACYGWSVQGYYLDV